MTWLLRHRYRAFLKSALWLVPLASMALALIAAPVVRRLDRLTGWTLDVSVDAVRDVGSALTAALLTIIVYVFSALLVAVQVASAQLTPRVIPLVFKDRVTKWALTVFAFTYTFLLSTLSSLQDPVPALSAWICAYASLACVVLFLFLIERVIGMLRPVAILTAVASVARKVVHSVYPSRIDEPAVRPSNSFPAERARLGQPERTVEHRAVGYLLAFDQDGLVKMATHAQCVIEMVPRVGDFVVAQDDPLFRIYGNGQALDVRALRQTVAYGSERTMEQDPAFAFRIIVDMHRRPSRRRSMTRRPPSSHWTRSTTCYARWACASSKQGR